MDDASPVRVFKIATVADWDSVGEVYRGSADDVRDGFIHLSAEDQIAGTRARYFAGRDDLVLVEIDAGALGEALTWEASRGGALFPHLYAPLPMGAVVSVRKLA